MTSAPTDRAQRPLIEALSRLSYRRSRVSLLLGSDEDIGHETRVALTPGHIRRLLEDLETLGLEARIFAVAGAGKRARIGDRDYAALGVTVLERDQLDQHGVFDVVHALKEPTEYESRLPGPFLRIGALHLASKPPGVCALLGSKVFAGIVDGGTVGSCSYHQVGGDRTPIVGSMSRFAGRVAGEKLLEGLEQNGLGPGKVVVTGGGIAGWSAIETIREKTSELWVIDPFPAARERLAKALPELGFERFTLAESITDSILAGATGIIFAHRSGASVAEKVCTFEQIQQMKKGAAVIDIAIDQGGSILHDDYREEDDVQASKSKYEALLADYFYYAETNMPREAPRKASRMHGYASLPYVTALLALCAREGDAAGAVAALERREVATGWKPEAALKLDFLACIEQDLRNGLQLTSNGQRARITHPDIAGDAALSEWISHCAEGDRPAIDDEP